MSFTKSIPTHPKDIHRILTSWSSTKKLLFMALMAALAAILQSAGGFLPGIGYAISPFATAPILLVALMALRSGIFTYIVTICLLVLIEPSELVIFPFTTGLLGLGLGWSFHLLSKRTEIIITNALLLSIGICTPLYVFGFPVFGPTVSSSFNPAVLLIIFIFSLLYSWLWMELGLFILRRIKAILVLK
ncbi:hypothetical protein [Sporosarcina sp. FSL K6-2383]|uniref:hypothetical protein n=1 Tax=Sporosarcina sp. FSL K6-2383 TaxID=2921556 RepID=UPI00315A8320